MLSRTIGLALITNGMSSCSALKADDSGNITSTNFSNIFTLIGLHTNDTANAFFFTS